MHVNLTETGQSLLTAIAPVGFIVGGFLLGLGIERFAVRPFGLALLKNGHSRAARLLRGVHGTLTLVTTALGAHAMLVAYPLRPAYRDEANETLVILVVVAATVIAARAFSAGLREYLQSHTQAVPSASLFVSLLRIAVYAIGALLVLQILGISIAPLLAALGVGGLAIALALKDTLENLFSGLQIIASRQVRPGDYIKLETGNEGYVTDITWRNTTIRELGNNLVIVPNQKLAQSIFTNYALPDHALALVVVLAVPHTADLMRTEQVALEVAREFAEAPYARYQELGSENVKLAIFLRIDEYADQFAIRSDLLKRLHARLKDEGILVAPAAPGEPPPATLASGPPPQA